MSWSNRERIVFSKSGRVVWWVRMFGWCVGWTVFLLCVWVQWVPLPGGLERPRLWRVTGVYEDSRGGLIAELPAGGSRSHRPVALEEMGPWLPALSVGREDRRFWSHPGVDFRSIGGALVRGRGGASTITQQVVKMATRRSRAGYGTKLYEALVALQLERRWGKRRILEEYLNSAPYGNRLTGVEAASVAYFGKVARNVTKDEAAFLAGLPQAPSRFNPWRNAERAREQFVRTVEMLRSRGVIGADEVLVPPDVGRSLPVNKAPHFVGALLEAGGEGGRGGTWSGGAHRCSLDLRLQAEMELVCRRHLGALNRDDIGDAAFVVLENKSAAVRALGSVSRVGAGRDSVNGALMHRSCGSTLKPFVYLAAIEKRLLTAATVLPDTADAVREVYPDYDPHNFVSRHAGPVRVREALAGSLNVPAVVALGMVGARPVHDACRKWGIRFNRPLRHSGAGFILGNAGVTLLDLVAAYSGLARGGVALRPWFSGEDPSGWERVADTKSVEIITDILCDNEARSGSFGWHSPLATGRRIAVKTGTSAGYRDAWTVGFTREHTVGVWVGNFDGRPMSRTASIVAAAPLWRAVIDGVFAGDSGVDDPIAKKAPVCALSGLLPSVHSRRTVGELFLAGTAPTLSSDSWFSSDGVPLLPAEYAGWCATADNTMGARIGTGSGQLRILVPRADAVYAIDPRLPLRQQQLEFRVNQGAGVVWRLNGEPLTPGSDGRIVWQLEEGEWSLEVSNGAGTDTHRFRVIPPE